MVGASEYFLSVFFSKKLFKPLMRCRGNNIGLGERESQKQCFRLHCRAAKTQKVPGDATVDTMVEWKWVGRSGVRQVKRSGSGVKQCWRQWTIAGRIVNDDSARSTRSRVVINYSLCLRRDDTRSRCSSHRPPPSIVMPTRTKPLEFDINATPRFTALQFNRSQTQV